MDCLLANFNKRQILTSVCTSFQEEGLDVCYDIPWFAGKQDHEDKMHFLIPNCKESYSDAILEGKKSECAEQIVVFWSHYKIKAYSFEVSSDLINWGLDISDKSVLQLSDTIFRTEKHDAQMQVSRISTGTLNPGLKFQFNIP